jgi:hypothetical protein
VGRRGKFTNGKRIHNIKGLRETKAGVEREHAEKKRLDGRAVLATPKAEHRKPEKGARVEKKGKPA